MKSSCSTCSGERTRAMVCGHPSSFAKLQMTLIRRCDQQVVRPDLELFHDIHPLGVCRHGEDIVPSADFLDKAFVLVDESDLVAAAEQGFRNGEPQFAGSYDGYFHAFPLKMRGRHKAAHIFTLR